MKKLSIFLSIIMLFISVSFVGCKKQNDNLIRISEVTHSIFYAPLYVAINKGYFKENNLEISLHNAGGSDLAMTSLITKSADVALLGPETAVSVSAQGKKDLPIIFGQLTKKDGSFLISKVAQPHFDWSNLNNSHIIAGRRGGSPAMSLQLALEKKGYNIQSDLNFDLSVSFNNIVPAFEDMDENGYITAFEPTASNLLRQGKGHIVASVGEASGNIPFTVFMANQSYLNKNKTKATKFLQAIKKGYDFLQTATMEEIINSLKPSFKEFSNLDIQNSIENYKKIDAWSNTPQMSEESFNNLQNMMINSKILEESKRQSYSKLVDNSFALSIK